MLKRGIFCDRGRAVNSKVLFKVYNGKIQVITRFFEVLNVGISRREPCCNVLVNLSDKFLCEYVFTVVVYLVVVLLQTLVDL